MKALILAAGLGERMRPLTDTTPKPLLPVAGKPLIAWHVEKLAAIGVRDIIVNTSWLAPRFPQVLGDGAQWGVHLQYSYEGPTPLETGGGMWHARTWLGDAPFLAVNGDIWTDFDFAALPREPAGDAHLVLVDNPEHHPTGDFLLHGDGRVADEAIAGDTVPGDAAEARLTFAGIGVYRPSLFDDWRACFGDAPGVDEQPPRFKLAPLLRRAMHAGRVSGCHHRGRWTDVGTPARLAQLDADLRSTVD